MKKIFLIIIILFLSTVALNYAYAGSTSGSTGGTSLTDPLGNKTPQVLIGQVINAALGVVGSLALAMFIYGGFTWMLSAGNSQAVEKGKGILTWAAIGLIIIFTSYVLVNFVFQTVLGVT